MFIVIMIETTSALLSIIMILNTLKIAGVYGGRGFTNKRSKIGTTARTNA